jgi:hypothetical protein
MNIIIEGDKNAFNSKSAIVKFKEYIKKNNLFDINDLQLKFINYNYKLELIEKTDEFYRFNIILKDKQIIKNKINIKNKLMELKSARSKIDDSSNNLINLYNRLKNINSKVPLPSPDEVKKEPEKYKIIIETLITTLSKKLGDTSNYVKYFKLLKENYLNNLIINNDEQVIIPDEIIKHEIIENLNSNIVNSDTDTEES